MNQSSKKNKGNRYELYLVDVLRAEVDSKTHRTPGSGSGLDKNDIRLPNFDVEIEAKNAKVIHLLQDWEQMKVQLTGENMGVLMIRNPKKSEFEETLVVIDLADFIALLKVQKEETTVIETKDPELKYSINRLVDAGKDTLKKLKKSEDLGL